MHALILVFIGGGIGSAARYAVTTMVKNLIATSFPFGTLAVNIVGSFLMGIIITIITGKFNYDSENARLLLTVGFLGGFTTFSSFSIETLTLIENRELFFAISNVAANIIFGLIAAWFGIILIKNCL